MKQARTVMLPQLREILGYPTQFLEQPELERVGWHARQPIGEIIYYEAWGHLTHPNWPSLDVLVPGMPLSKGEER